MGVGSGDRLARGAVRASFGPLDVTKEKWEAAFAPADPEPEVVEIPLAEPNVHVRVGIK